MKILVYLMTFVLFSTAVAQNPTILTGNYITNVFGNSNFILNPNAQTGLTNVTTVTATVTRSTTTPLVATSEFTVAIGTANGTATWATRAFDAGMKGQNCEARFTYRGFAATSKVHIKQGANTVASLNLTPATDPRIASINFPCGDLSTATTFVVTDTAILAGTNEIGAIYTGLATNMANVAQAETVVIASGANQTITNTGTFQTVIYTSESSDVYGEYNTSTGVFTAKRAGRYLIDAAMIWDTTTWAAGDNIEIRVYKGTTAQISQFQEFESATAQYRSMQINGIIDVAVGETITIAVTHSSGTNKSILNSSLYNYFHISRFPTSSELVVTPERQNWFIDAKHAGSNPSLGNTTKTSRTEITDAGLTLTPFAGSQPVATLCASGNNPPALSTSATTCAAGNEALGLTFNIPSVGSYEVCAQFGQYQDLASNGTADVSISLEETSTTSSTPLTTNPTNTRYSFITATANITTAPYNQCNTFKFDSVGQKAVRLMYFQNASGTINNNFILGDENRGRAINWSVKPVTNQSNSALYVQGPVLGAQTGAAIPSGYLGKSEFGGGSGSSGAVSTGTFTLYTISNVTPGVYLARSYASTQRTGANTATYAGYSCKLTTNASLSVNWFDFLNGPADNFGSASPAFTGFGSGGHLGNSSASLMQIVNVTTTSTYYLRCGVDSNNSGMQIAAGAEFIRIN